MTTNEQTWAQKGLNEVAERVELLNSEIANLEKRICDETMDVVLTALNRALSQKKDELDRSNKDLIRAQGRVKAEVEAAIESARLQKVAVANAKAFHGVFGGTLKDGTNCVSWKTKAGEVVQVHCMNDGTFLVSLPYQYRDWTNKLERKVKNEKKVMAIVTECIEAMNGRYDRTKREANAMVAMRDTIGAGEVVKRWRKTGTHSSVEYEVIEIKNVLFNSPDGDVAGATGSISVTGDGYVTFTSRMTPAQVGDLIARLGQ